MWRTSVAESLPEKLKACELCQKQRGRANYLSPCPFLPARLSKLDQHQLASKGYRPEIQRPSKDHLLRAHPAALRGHQLLDSFLPRELSQQGAECKRWRPWHWKQPRKSRWNLAARATRSKSISWGQSAAVPSQTPIRWHSYLSIPILWQHYHTL